ncbi:MAG: hypothetical protein ACI8W3_001780 [Myxococcota bacterium]
MTDRRSAACGDLPSSHVNTLKDLDSNTLVDGYALARPLQRHVRQRAD